MAGVSFVSRNKGLAFRTCLQNTSDAFRLAGLAGLGLLSLFCFHYIWWNESTNGERVVCSQNHTLNISSVLLYQMWCIPSGWPGWADPFGSGKVLVVHHTFKQTRKQRNAIIEIAFSLVLLARVFVCFGESFGEVYRNSRSGKSFGQFYGNQTTGKSSVWFCGYQNARFVLLDLFF